MRLLFLCFFLLAIQSCKENPEKIKPSVETISESVYASGIIKSKNQYQVFATVNGLIDKFYISEGDTIKSGEPILSISNESSKLGTENAKLAAEFADESTNTQKLNESRLAIEFAQTKMKNDSLQMVRQRALWASNIGSQIELEQRELAFANSKTGYESALLRYNDLKKQINFTSKQSKKNLSISQVMEDDFLIKSKIDGIVYSVLKEKGEMVNAQMPLAIIGDAKEFILELQVDEYDIVKVLPGQIIYVTLDSYKGEVFEALVEKVYPLMNERTKTFTVDAKFSKSPPVLYPNLTLEATILIRKKEKALTVPINYVSIDGYVLKSDGEKIKVATGLKDYQKVEILSGIGKDDELIIPKE
ncbi:MAG: efflux RND transporter periplasmic adaptor subunit [Bacteroidia bacterium]|nr:efflux RND transporter periplasmic adaptor subunit [Bacteroidia bacterium]